MEAQLQRPVHGHEYEQDPQMMGSDQGTGEYNQQGKKKSVLKKVKDKAKKLKDTIKKPGQGQVQEHENRYDDSPEEEEDDDEERVNDPEIHGAPIYESTVIKSTNLPKQVDTNLEKPNDTREDRYDDPIVKDEGITWPAVPGKMEHEMERPPAMELPTFENKNASSPVNPGPKPGEEANAGEPRVKIGPLMGLEEDPHSPKNRSGEIPPSNYQSKVTDPTDDGGEEVEVAPLIRKFDNLNVDESGIKPKSEQRSHTGSHDQFAPQPTPTKDQFSTESNPVSTLGSSESSPKSFDSNKAEGTPRDTVTGKIYSATSAITDKAVSAKNVVASKLGYGGNIPEGQDTTKKPVSESAAEYAQPTPTKDQFCTESNPVSTLDDSESSPKSFDSNKAEGMPRDTVTGKISSATSAITDRAVSAKNVVASKLGYGGNIPEGQDTTKKPVSESAAEYAQPGQDTTKKPVSESAAEYANIVSEKLAPVYGKVAGAGTAVLSKFQGSGGTENQGEGDTAAKGTDKGVTMTGYLAEKFRPGDEDKALSETITDALHKKKGGSPKTQEEEPPMGKVTESEEVATRLGTGTEKKREGEDALAAGMESTGPGVVGRVKDAVSSWLGKSTGMQTAQDSINQSYVSDAVSDPVGEVGQGDEVARSQHPRLQESSN